MYIHQIKQWPKFSWNTDVILSKLGDVRQQQGIILGIMSQAGFKIQETAMLNTLTLDVTKSTEIEGEKLNTDQVRSSIARRLGIELAGAVPADRNVDGVVEMMLDATQNYKDELTEDRLFNWHAALFPTGRSGLYAIKVGGWRTAEAGPMQVVSGGIGREKVHFEAPEATRLVNEMRSFLIWFNDSPTTDSILKAAIAHLWFITIHPFDDGNGRITRALADLLLARADGTANRFYSMSAQILSEENAYYHILEHSQKGSLDITAWLGWFLSCLFDAMKNTENTLKAVSLRNNFWETHRETPLNERQKQMLSVLLEDFVGTLTTGKWAKMTKSSSDTALRDIQDLTKKSILRKDAGGSKNTAYRLIEMD